MIARLAEAEVKNRQPEIDIRKFVPLQDALRRSEAEGSKIIYAP